MSSAPPTDYSTGWASPALLRASPALLSIAQRALKWPATRSGALPAVPSAAMAATLALSLGNPTPCVLQLQAAGEVLVALCEQRPVPSHPPLAIFLQPYSPTIAALNSGTLLALLRGCQLAALPEPTMSHLLACTAQRYASLPPAQFQAEVGDPCPAIAGLVVQWWQAHFFPQPAPPLPAAQALHTPMCICAAIVAAPSASHSLQWASFGLLPDSPAADFWARGLDFSSLPPPICAYKLASKFCQVDWMRRHWPTTGSVSLHMASALRLLDPAPSFSVLLDLLRVHGPGDAVLAHSCSMLLWKRVGHCPSSLALGSGSPCACAACAPQGRLHCAERLCSPWLAGRHCFYCSRHERSTAGCPACCGGSAVLPSPACSCQH